LMMIKPPQRAIYALTTEYSQRVIDDFHVTN